MSSSRSLLLSLSAVAFIATGSFAIQVIDTHYTIEKRIQEGLLPPVLIKGLPLSGQTMRLSDRMADLRVPGASVAVIRDGKLEWAHGFGVTKTGGAAVTAETLFQAASISKPLTAMAVLRLVESGKLDLDRDVNDYLKTWKVPENEFTAKKKVTLRELLGHTGGVTVHGFAGYASGDPLPTLVQILNGEKPANSGPIRVDVEPGTVWRYSGGGYVITQQLLEDVTRKPFPRLMRELVLDPIGMKHSTYEQPLPPARMPEAAMPYDRNGVPIAGGPHVYPEMAPAGLWTTPSELALYALEIQSALLGKNRVLSTTMIRQMLAPGMGDWGLGLQVGGKEHPLFAHGGSNEGYQCYLVAYDSGDGAVVMTNGDRGGQLAEDIVSTIAFEYKWPDFQPGLYSISKIDPKVFDAYVGTYQLAPDFVMTVTRDGDHFMTQATGQRPVEIFPENDHQFFAKVVNAELTFVTDSTGRARELILHQNGVEHRAPRKQ